MIRQKLQQGFTLIEMLVIAPIVILAIGAFLTIIISMTGEVLASRASNIMTYDIQDALNRIEQDVKLSTTFLPRNSVTPPTTDTVPAPQGVNDDTTSFINEGGPGGTTLILNALVTNDNPLSTTAGLVYLAGKPFPCNTSRTRDNTPMTMNIVYFIKDNALWRRTIMPSDYAAGTSVSCTTPWQQPSCSEGYSNSFCKTDDIKLVEGVTSSTFNIAYYTSANAPSANATASNPNTAVEVRAAALAGSPTVEVSIGASQVVAGRNVERSASVRTTRLDTNASTIAASIVTTSPNAPTLSSVINPDGPSNVNFKWTGVDSATGYTFQYNVNGGAWQTPVNNQPNVTSYTVTAGGHTDTINGRVTATNSAGTSDYGTSALTIPRWATVPLQNGWNDYGSPAVPSGFTKTSSGTIVLKGLLKVSPNSTNPQLIMTLPEGYRPAEQLIYQRVTTLTTFSRIDIMPTGEVYVVAAVPSISLDGIVFQDASVSFTTLATSNGWVAFSTGGIGFTPRYFIDGSGRVQLHALVSSGTTTDNTVISTLPAAATPNQYLHIGGVASSGTGLFGVSASPSALVAKGSSNVLLAVNVLYYPSSRATGSTCTTQWCNLTMANSWVHYGAPHATPQYTKGSDNIVSLKGLIRNGTTTSGTQIASVLPAGYRPVGGTLTMTVISNGAVGRLDINSSGQLLFMSGSNTWFSLDGINFLAE